MSRLREYAQKEDPARGSVRGHDVVDWLAVSAVAVVAIAGLAPTIEEYLVSGRFISDAVVYARVAFNISHGQGSTYDLLTRTNGYHPLWLLIHLPFGYSSDTVLQTLSRARFLWMTTALASAIAWGLYARRITNLRWAFSLTALMIGVFGIFGWSLHVMYSGMETPLVLLMLALTMLVFEKISRGPTLHLALLLGLLVSLTVLSRLDSLIVLFPLGLAAFLNITRESPRSGLALVYASAGLISPYLLWNLIAFGRVMPVSGLAKTTMDSGLQTSLDRLTAFCTSLRYLEPGVMGIVALMSLIAVAVLITCLVRKLLPASFWLLAIGAALHYTYYLAFMSEIHVSWHLYPQMVVTLVATSVLAAQLLDWLKPHFAFAVAAGVLVLFGLANHSVAERKVWRTAEMRQEIQLARWVQNNVPESARIVLYDGFIPAAIADRHMWIDSNGLSGDAALASLARENRAAMIRNQPQPNDIARIMNADLIAERCVSRYTDQDQVVFRSASYPRKGETCRISLTRLH